MVYSMYSVLDANIGYGMPICQENDAVAMRSFENACSQLGSIYNTHPGDFTLYYVGTFDTSSGVLEFEEHRRVCSALDFVGNLNNERSLHGIS